jgi:hypothetical protein
LKALASLTAFLRGVQEPPHHYRASLQTFPDLDQRVIAKQLELQKCAEQASQAIESRTSGNLDVTEHRILSYMQDEQRRSRDLLAEELATADERLSALDFDGRFALIRNTVPQVLSEFRTEAVAGRDELFRLQRSLKEVELEREAFKRENYLVREARLQSNSSKILKGGILAIIAVMEIGINSVYLAKGNDLGLIGGATQAIVFALFNILFSFLIAAVGVRQLNHVRISRKIIGILSLAVFCLVIVALNISLGHYREISSSVVDDGGLDVLRRLKEAPFDLADFQSWVFVGIGILFAVIAFADAFLIFDPYPGYAAIQKRVNEAHQKFIMARDDRVDDLREIRNEAVSGMEKAHSDLTRRRTEFDSILLTKIRIVRSFDAHQPHIQQVLDALIAEYRAYLVELTPTKTIAFAPSPTVIKSAHLADEDSAQERGRIRKRVEEAQVLLSSQISEIHKVFEEAAISYQSIEDLVTSGASDESAKEASTQ